MPYFKARGLCHLTLKDVSVCASALPPVKEFHLAPKINLYNYIIELLLVNRIRRDYTILMAQDIVSQIHKLLINKHYTLATAESCTGGLIAKLLTDLSGSSKYFILGIISYSNQAKIKFLQVPSKLISKKGAVSREVALKMADSVKKLAKTDFGIAITGIAGPGGGSAKKAVGTVFIAITGKNQKTCSKFNFKGNRDTIRRLAALKSLKLLKILL